MFVCNGTALLAPPQSPRVLSRQTPTTVTRCGSFNNFARRHLPSKQTRVFLTTKSKRVQPEKKQGSIKVKPTTLTHLPDEPQYYTSSVRKPSTAPKTKAALHQTENVLQTTRTAQPGHTHTIQKFAASGMMHYASCHATPFQSICREHTSPAVSTTKRQNTTLSSSRCATIQAQQVATPISNRGVKYTVIVKQRHAAIPRYSDRNTCTGQGLGQFSTWTKSGNQACLIIVHSVSPACLRHTHKRSTCTAAAVFKGSSTDAESHTRSRKNSSFSKPEYIHDPETTPSCCIRAHYCCTLGVHTLRATHRGT